MSYVPFSAGRRGVGLGVKLAAVVAVAGLGLVGLNKLTGWSPVHVSAPHLHIPPVSQDVTGPSTSTIILQHIQALGEVHADNVTYSWGKTVSSRHTFLGVTTGTAKHTVTLEATVPVAVDVTHAAFAIPAPNELVLSLPAPVPGTPSIDPATQQQVDSCARHVPISPLFSVNLARSCPGDTLAYQAEAIKAVTAEAAHDTAMLNGARAQVASLLSCLVAPTGWQVQVAWTDQPAPASFTGGSCATPMPNRLPALPTPTTGAP